MSHGQPLARSLLLMRRRSPSRPDLESTFLPTLGIDPVLGRNSTTAEDRPNAPRVALISYGLWLPTWPWLRSRDHSLRSARMGSTEAARRAGK